MLNKLGLDKTDPVKVRSKTGEAAVSDPRDVVAACLPDPLALGPNMTGKTCAGHQVAGTGKDGKPRDVYLYHVADNAWTMAEYKAQAVVWRAAMNPVHQLLNWPQRAWSGAGVLKPGGLRRRAGSWICSATATAGGGRSRSARLLSRSAL